MADSDSNDDRDETSFFLQELRTTEMWDETEAKKHGRSTLEQFEKIDLSTMPEVIHSHNWYMKDSKLYAERANEAQDRLFKKEKYRYPLTLVFVSPDVRVYYKSWALAKKRVENAIFNIRNEHDVTTDELFKPLIALILGSFDRRLPPKFAGNFDEYSGIFKSNTLKERLARAESKFQYFEELGDVLGYAQYLQAQTSDAAATRRLPIHDLHEILDIWVREVEEERRVKDAASSEAQVAEVPEPVKDDKDNRDDRAWDDEDDVTAPEEWEKLHDEHVARREQEEKANAVKAAQQAARIAKMKEEMDARLEQEEKEKAERKKKEVEKIAELKRINDEALAKAKARTERLAELEEEAKRLAELEKEEARLTKAAEETKNNTARKIKTERLHLIETFTMKLSETEVEKLENRILANIEEERQKFENLSLSLYDESSKKCHKIILGYFNEIVFIVSRLTSGQDFRLYKKTLFDSYRNLYGFIFASLDIQEPNDILMKKLTFHYDFALFEHHAFKTKWTATIIAENETNMHQMDKDGKKMIFLHAFLLFSEFVLKREVDDKRTNRFDNSNESYTGVNTEECTQDFASVLADWERKVNNNEVATVEEEEGYDNFNETSFPDTLYPKNEKPDWENEEIDEQPQIDPHPQANEASQNISPKDIKKREQKYRTHMASVIDNVNIQWRRLAILAPSEWYAESLLCMSWVTTALEDAMKMHDFDSESWSRRSKSGESWDDIQPLSVHIIFDNATPRRLFLRSVLDTLKTSLETANAQRQSRSGDIPSFFGNDSYNRAYQRAIGFALVCVKRLFWRWHMDATFKSAFRSTVAEEKKVKQYFQKLYGALINLTYWYRIVACYRAVQDSNQHDLNYTEDYVQKSNITRCQLETPVPSTVTYMGQTTEAKKYRLSNPIKKPEYCKIYVDIMYALCKKTYERLRDIWRLDATSWHERAKFYANRILLIYLDPLQRTYIYGTNSVAKRYWSRKWNMGTGRKDAVEEKWFDHFVQTEGNGLSFFGWMYQEFFNLQQDSLENGFTANPIFPGKVCFSRKYIQRIRYLKTSLKRVLYMMIYKQIPFSYECQLLVQDAIVTASIYLEVVLAIYALQQSESHSLDYMKASWKWKCEAELAIPEGRPVPKLPVAGWGK